MSLTGQSSECFVKQKSELGHVICARGVACLSFVLLFLFVIFALIPSFIEQNVSV